MNTQPFTLQNLTNNCAFPATHHPSILHWICCPLPNSHCSPMSLLSCPFLSRNSLLSVCWHNVFVRHNIRRQLLGPFSRALLPSSQRTCSHRFDARDTDPYVIFLSHHFPCLSSHTVLALFHRRRRPQITPWLHPSDTDCARVHQVMERTCIRPCLSFQVMHSDSEGDAVKDAVCPKGRRLKRGERRMKHSSYSRAVGERWPLHDATMDTR
ncbi:hypothetical protein BC826DRAFT_995793 [Russula brevipes]|nr:hypothetical protein BC826DRAFT_995793 [Russula brevipes]